MCVCTFLLVVFSILFVRRWNAVNALTRRHWPMCPRDNPLLLVLFSYTFSYYIYFSFYTSLSLSVLIYSLYDTSIVPTALQQI